MVRPRWGKFLDADAGELQFAARTEIIQRCCRNIGTEAGLKYVTVEIKKEPALLIYVHFDFFQPAP